jgi:UDP-N-acetylmuramoylalanine--D-glutamate ligase
MVEKFFFKNKRITVFGLGTNMGGIGTVKFLIDQGVREVIVTDIKSREELGTALEKLAKYKNVTYVLGQHRPEDFTRVDMVIKNPIIPWTNEYVKLAEKNKIPVEMDSSIFFLLCKAPIIGVTGTKGKTTTAALTAHILEQSGKHVVRAGIGQAGVLPMLEKITPESVVVFELSSWRLSALSHIQKSPHIAVVTNIYPDHLNYYKTLESYVADKRNIFLFQKQNDSVIANAEDVLVRDIVQDAPGRTLWFSASKPIEGDGMWRTEEVLFVRQGEKESVFLPLDQMPLLGEHNIGNVLSAALACLVFGTKLEQVRTGVKSFPGVPHRLEVVAEKQGVRYINDTTATIPEAAIAALRSFAEPVILIAGGSDKRLEFDEFAKAILAYSKGLILFKGAATEKILQALKKNLPEEDKEKQLAVVESMEKAVELASRNALPGDVVLLSPGATSFGIFKNEFDRGEQFRKAVNDL